MVGKIKTRFVCEACGAAQSRWVGKCPACGEWNTLTEQAVASGSQDGKRGAESGWLAAPPPRPISDGSAEPPSRLRSGLEEFDRVCGGGIVPGSLTLIGGDPGIGKSTLMLQVSRHIARTTGPVLYVSGEESFEQSRLRARRLNALEPRLFLYNETLAEIASEELRRGSYTFAVIDSIQSMQAAGVTSVPGSMGQVRECANAFLRTAKEVGVPIAMIGHVTKDGVIAGPRLLEHLVDTVLYFEGESRHALRVLRAVKNRFGPTNEVGVFEMTDGGLVEVDNPSAVFLDERPVGVSGSVVFPAVEGSRPMLVEVQALVGEPHGGPGRRTVTGLHSGRVALTLAVLEKRAGIRLTDRDVFVNVAGGARVEEPAADLAIALAVASSCLDRPVPDRLAAFGELGLAGEVRGVASALERMAEAAKFGFDCCVCPPLPKNRRKQAAAYGQARMVTRLTEAIRNLLEN
ncbi:MAG TPA: DNA repair protein RadA [Candidatus Hydrogenedentes bacterium]|nr:DNA repair protein RadA [Candidatus Hydrogenedentota bacterium]HOK88840.1 DNA repair protein RadA [Candidatus Hydrogenedentota bacterium]